MNVTDVQTISLVALRTWKKTIRRPITLVFSLLQPLLWMLFFGFLMHRYPLSELPEGISYISFLVPGICAMTVLFGASQAGISLVRDLQTGFLQRVLSTPAASWALHFGKIGADGGRLLVQAVAVMVLGLFLGASLQFVALPLLVSFFGVFCFAVGFGSLSCLISLRSRNQETMATFVHLVNMPLFFTSTALVPHKQMPSWLAMIAGWNPLTLVVEGLRGALLFGSTPPYLSNTLPLLLLAMFFMVAVVMQMRRGVEISAWELK